MKDEERRRKRKSIDHNNKGPFSTSQAKSRTNLQSVVVP
jgi:hypothetical protein